MFGPSGTFFGSLTDHAVVPATIVAGADDGLSTETVGGNIFARLGQPGGAAGDPAKLNEDRYIPMNNKRVFFAKGTWPVYNGTVGTDGNRVDIFNDLSVDDNFLEMFNGTNNAAIRVPLGFYILDPGLGGINTFQFNYGSIQWETDPITPTNLQASGNLGMGVTVVDPTASVYNMLYTDAFILWNATIMTGLTLNINPSLFVKKLIIVRNISTTNAIGNAILFTAPSAVIYTLGAASPTSFTTVATTRCHIYFCDGVKIYQLSTA